MTRAFIGLGSNLGDRRATLEAAVDQLREHVRVVKVAPFIETPALLASPESAPQPAYLNSVAWVETSLSAHELLELLRSIEQRLGRVRSRKWSARTVDLDLLLFGDERIDTPQLVVPHPQLHLRRFVLEPLATLDATLVHPVLGQSVATLLAALSDG